MAKIVDKEKKKRDIALSAADLILQKGVHNITVTEVAKAAGIGKGTVYEYFKTKNEIVFELVNTLLQEYSKQLKEELDKLHTTKEKIRAFSRFYYAPEQEKLRKLYKEFISISLITQDREMIEFNEKSINIYLVWFEEIIREGVRKGELRGEALLLTKGLFVTGEGLFIQNNITGKEAFIQHELDTFIDAIFALMEVRT